MEKKQPTNQEIQVTFYRESGKWYASGKAFVNHYLFQDEYKQDIVNTQDCLSDSWPGNYFVVTSSSPDAEGFHEALFLPEDFRGLKKQPMTERIEI